MPKCYSRDLREKVLRYVDGAGGVVSASELFGIGRNTISSWLKLRKESGDIAPKKFGGNKRKIDYSELESYVKANPDKHLSEIGAEFGVSGVCIWKAFRKLGISHKKRRRLTSKGTKHSVRHSDRK